MMKTKLDGIRECFVAPIRSKYGIGGKFVTGNDREFYITKVLYNNPATVVFWSDGTKTVNVVPEGVEYNGDAGLAFCVLKKIMTNKAAFDLFDSWGTDDLENKKSFWKTLGTIRREQKRRGR